MPQINVFENYYQEYDDWFVNNNDIFTSELNTIKCLLPMTGKGIEIGVGTGQFASKLGITIGVEPSTKMSEIAKKRNIEVIIAKAESLPIENEIYDYATMITTICFVKDVEKALNEANRILKSNGVFIIAFIDKDSDLGKIYQIKKASNKFYKNATFYSTTEIIKQLKKANFKIDRINQCLFIKNGDIDATEIKDSYGTGGFVVIKSIKTKEGEYIL